jgi:hypothetical protein
MVHVSEEGDYAVELDVSTHDNVFALAAFELEPCEVALQFDAVDQTASQSRQKRQSSQDRQDHTDTPYKGYYCQLFIKNNVISPPIAYLPM